MQGLKKVASYPVSGIVRNTSFLWRRDEGMLVRHLRKLFRTLEIDVVVDIGANRGRYIEILRGCIGFAGPIFAFEPIPENAELIRKRYAFDGDLSVMPVALGRRNERRVLKIMRHDPMSSFLNPVDDEIGRHKGLNEVVREIEVEVRTLDSVAVEIGSGDPAGRIFVKIDAQGADLDILAGGAQFMSKVRGLQVEVPFTPLYEAMPPAARYFEAAADAGFALTGLFPVHRLKDQRIIDVDAVFRRV